MVSFGHNVSFIYYQVNQIWSAEAAAAAASTAAEAAAAVAGLSGSH